MRHLMLSCLILCRAVSFAEAGSIELTIGKIEHDKGNLLIAIFDKGDNWLSAKPDKPPFMDASHVVAGKDDAVVVINDVPAGTYAISVFHDLNGNSELDTNFVGFPKEPFGFSAPMGKFGPPKFEKASFTVSDDINRLRIDLN